MNNIPFFDDIANGDDDDAIIKGDFVLFNNLEADGIAPFSSRVCDDGDADAADEEYDDFMLTPWWKGDDDVAAAHGVTIPALVPKLPVDVDDLSFDIDSVLQKLEITPRSLCSSNSSSSSASVNSSNSHSLTPRHTPRSPLILSFKRQRT